MKCSQIILKLSSLPPYMEKLSSTKPHPGPKKVYSYNDALGIENQYLTV